MNNCRLRTRGRRRRLLVCVVLVSLALPAAVPATATAAQDPHAQDSGFVTGGGSSVLLTEVDGVRHYEAHESVTVQPKEDLVQGAAVAVACSPAATYVIKANTPTLESSSVESTGSVTQTPNWYCLVDQVWLRGQTKVCGFWGCNWHTKANAAHNGRTSSWSNSVTQSCRGGTHRYRTQTGMSFRTISGHIGVIPTYAYHLKTVESAVQPELTCT